MRALQTPEQTCAPPTPLPPSLQSGTDLEAPPPPPLTHTPLEQGSHWASPEDIPRSRRPPLAAVATAEEELQDEVALLGGHQPPPLPCLDSQGVSAAA